MCVEVCAWCAYFNWLRVDGVRFESQTSGIFHTPLTGTAVLASLLSLRQPFLFQHALTSSCVLVFAYSRDYCGCAAPALIDGKIELSDYEGEAVDPACLLPAAPVVAL